MNFKKRRENRKAKKEAKRDPYDILERRLQLKLLEMESGTAEFQEIQKELKEVNASRAESRESKRKISKQDKGGIIIKILGIFGAGAGLASIIWAEKQGMTFTGEKRGVMSAISRGIGDIFVRR